MNVADDLATGFLRNTGYLNRQIADIDHDESLRQVDGVNCLNWTVGHIVHYRNVVLRALEASPIDGLGSRYDRESDPILSDGPDVLAFGTLRGLFQESGEVVADAIRSSDGDLGRPVMVGDQEVALGSRLQFYLFHDTLHVGQADVLAAMA
ncbi:MAG: DinB family protein [Acidimicrobiia bacterium]|nr:DinB family protein [Acidimicrobiia bacterium]MDH5421009.1 DinB family protein [Acidimicrobiia bacterium]MDH5503942.1 DinB family protein [Acidimicrobiia bacterium]